MSSPDKQKMRVTFEYEAEVFEGDPTDVYEIASAEYEWVNRILEDEFGASEVSVRPALGANE